MITLSQRRTFEFIKQYFEKNEYAPTASEIAKGIGIQSRGVVHRYLRALEVAGLIALTPKRHRNIRLMPQPSQQSLLPLVGIIAAGQPIEAIEQDESIQVADIFLGADRYALKVKGDSMVDEGILDGDIVVCQKSEIAEEGQIVVALIDRQEATLKRFQRSGQYILLIPANTKHKPMSYEAHRVEIQGIYIGLLRFGY